MTPAHDRWAAAAETGRSAGQRLTLKDLRAAGAGIGQRLGSASGESAEFIEHRAYEPGDDLRRIDWGVYARTDDLIIRRYRAEISPHVDIILDASRSMDLDQTPKADTAVAIAAACSEAAARSGLRPKIIAATTNARPIPGTPTSFANVSFESTHQSAPDLRPLGTTRPAARFLITDLMFPAEPRSVLLQLIGPGAFSGVICILSTRERDTARLKGRRLSDRETGERSTLEVSDRVLAEYAQRLQRHLASWSSAAKALGAAFVEINAEDVMHDQTLDVTPLIRAGMMEPKP